ncbi:MAG: NUDIX hydrolase [Armatimonadetes bacterium]|nr:NUDIX hydrolase [Armatimonadota bacterium]
MIEAAGGLVLRQSPQGREIALVHRIKHNDWTLPKGKLHPGERWQEAALREVWEETGLGVRLESFAGSAAYTVEGAPKVVLFWEMSVTEDRSFSPNREVDRLLWLPPSEALDKLDYEVERDLLRKFLSR